MARIESVEKYIREFNPENAIKEYSPKLSEMDYDDYISNLVDNF